MNLTLTIKEHIRANGSLQRSLCSYQYLDYVRVHAYLHPITGYVEPAHLQADWFKNGRDELVKVDEETAKNLESHFIQALIFAAGK